MCGKKKRKGFFSPLLKRTRGILAGIYNCHKGCELLFFIDAVNTKQTNKPHPQCSYQLSRDTGGKLMEHHFTITICTCLYVFLPSPILSNKTFLSFIGNSMLAVGVQWWAKIQGLPIWRYGGHSSKAILTERENMQMPSMPKGDYRRCVG